MVTASWQRRMKGQHAWLGSSRWLICRCQSRGGGPCCTKLSPLFQLRWVSMCSSTYLHLFSQIECSACGFVKFLLCLSTPWLPLRHVEMFSTLAINLSTLHTRRPLHSFSPTDLVNYVIDEYSCHLPLNQTSDHVNWVLT